MTLGRECTTFTANVWFVSYDIIFFKYNHRLITQHHLSFLCLKGITKYNLQEKCKPPNNYRIGEEIRFLLLETDYNSIHQIGNWPSSSSPLIIFNSITRIPCGVVSVLLFGSKKMIFEIRWELVVHTYLDEKEHFLVFHDNYLFSSLFLLLFLWKDKIGDYDEVMQEKFLTYRILVVSFFFFTLYFFLNDAFIHLSIGKRDKEIIAHSCRKKNY